MKINTSLVIVVSFLFFMLLSSNAAAMETGFDTIDLNKNLQEQYWINIQLSVKSIEDTSSKLCSFDVNENGQIALALCNNTINVYGSDNVYQYSYHFKTDGSYFVEWDRETLLIYLVRSSLLVQVDNQGNLIEIREVTNSYENSSYADSLRKTRQKAVNGNQYVMMNEHELLNLFAGYTYSKLVNVDSNGVENVVYDVGSNHGNSILYEVIGVFLFIAFVIGGLYRYTRSLPSGKRLVPGDLWIQRKHPSHVVRTDKPCDNQGTDPR